MHSNRLQIFVLSVSLVAFIVLGFVYFASIRNNEELTGDSRVDSSLKISNEKATLYIDENNNQTQDTKESFCKQCIGKQIITEINTSEGVQQVLTNISDKGKLELANSEAIMSWGYIDSEKLVIPVYSYSIEQQGKEIKIPVFEIGHTLTGENANIDAIDIEEISKGYYQISFDIPVLVPAMENALLSGKPTWIVYYPNGKNETNYYVSMAKVASNGGGTSLSGIWHIAEQYESLKEISSYALLLPKIN